MRRFVRLSRGSFASLSHNLKTDDLLSEIGTVEPDPQDCLIETLKF